MTDSVLFRIATPYREGSIGAITREALARSNLLRFHTTVYTGGLLERASHAIPAGAGRRLQGIMPRRSFGDIPRQQVTTDAALYDVLHLAARRIPRAEALAGQLMYSAKQAFDDRVARRLEVETPLRGEIVIAMAASGARTLQVARRTGRLSVLNMVNSHPIFQNRYLAELGGIRPGGPEWISERLQSYLESELAAADLILCPSMFVVNQLVSLGITRDRILLEPYGVDVSAFCPPKGGRRQTRSNITCLYVGQISHRKGIKTLISVARLLSHVRFILVGPIVSRELLADLPTNCRYLGARSHRDIATLMQRADIFVLPSFEDAFPLVTLEAMASGLPVIVSDHAGTSEVINDCANGMVFAAGHVEELSSRIESLAADPSMRSSVGVEARLTVVNGRTWTDYSARVVDALAGSVEQNAIVA